MGRPIEQLRAWGLIGALIVSSGVHAAESPVVPPTKLTVGTTLTSISAGPQTRAVYQFVATAGQALAILVEEHGLDVIVQLSDPRQKATAYKAAAGRNSKEYILLENAMPGLHTLTILSEELTGATGTHAVTLTAVSELKKDLLAAWRAMSQAGHLNHTGGTKGRGGAMAAYEAAATLWAAAHRPEDAAWAKLNQAQILYQHEFEAEAATEAAADALRIFKEANTEEPAAYARYVMAGATIDLASGMGAGPEAEVLFNRAQTSLEDLLSFYNNRADAFQAGHCLNLLGLGALYRNDYGAARSYFERSEVRFLTAKEYGGQQLALTNRATTATFEGYFLQAIPLYEEALNILPDQGFKADRAAIFDNLAYAHARIGNTELALRISQQARDLHRTLQDKAEIYSVWGLAKAYFIVGEHELAGDLLRELVDMTNSANDPLITEAALRHLGDIAYQKAEFAEALTFHQRALSKVSGPADRANLLMLIGRDQLALGKADEAQASTHEALAAARTADSQLILAATFQRMGQLSLERGKIAEASRYFEDALRSYTSLQLMKEQADALLGMAEAALAGGKAEAAVQLSFDAVERIERIRGGLLNPELRAYYGASHRPYYDTHVRALLSSGTPTALRDALTVSERARARLTLELLRESNDLASAERSSERDRHREALYADMSRIQHQISMTTGSEQAELRRLISDLEIQDDLLESEHRTQASTTDIATLDADGIQEILGPDTLLLQYALGDNVSYVWLVTRENISIVELSSRAEIEAVASNALELLRKPGSVQLTRKALQELANHVLLPAAPLPKKRNLVVSPDGALQYVPFAVLPTSAESTTPQVLRNAYDLSVTPSVSVVASMRGRGDPKPQGKTVAIFADPVFKASDERFSVREAPAVGPRVLPIAQTTRDPAQSTDLARLPYSGREASAIAALIDEDKRMLATGFVATRQNVLSMPLHQFRYLHFATHGRVDARYPELSSLELSQFNESGQPVNGALRMHDILGLNLNAELVTLSACDTALGREIHGEAMVGLAQSFLMAGARRLLVSLWQVPDRATAELMTKFYENMWTNAYRPSEALREAQMAISSQPRWRDPYYWGGFVLLGEWG